MIIELNQILSYLNEISIEYKFIGKRDITINKYSSFNNLESNCISWVKNQLNYKYEMLAEIENILLIIGLDVEFEKENTKDVGFIVCKNPKEAFFSILNNFYTQETYENYISSNSIVMTEVIGKDVYIGHNCYIDEAVTIENNVVIRNNVSIEGRVRIGKNTIIHSGVVIGSDGFGYFQNKEGKNVKVPHYGGVVIGDDVEIGANTCIDRGTLDDTIIGNNVKIDNLCHIGHNCIIGNNSSVIALSMLGGSAILEENSYIAPGVMIKNQIHIGENSLIGMGAVVIKNVEDNKVVTGVPAKVIRDNL